MTESLKLIASSRSIEVDRVSIRAGLSDRIVEDVSRLEPQRRGSGVRVADLLTLVEHSNATTLTLQSSDGFSATLPIVIAQDGFLIFEIDGRSLPVAAGGPFRFFTIAAAECGTAVADKCANVKGVTAIELS